MLGGGGIFNSPPLTFAYYLGVELRGGDCMQACYVLVSISKHLALWFKLYGEKHNKPIHMAREWSFNWIKNLIREYKLT